MKRAEFNTDITMKNELSFNDFLSVGLFNLKNDLIHSINEEGFKMLNMIRHPDNFHKAWWSDYPMIDGFYDLKHFDVRFAIGFSWMHIRANPIVTTGWKYDDDKFYTFEDESTYSKNVTFGQLINLMLEQNCIIRGWEEKIIKTT